MAAEKGSRSWLPAYLSQPEASPFWKLPSSIPVGQALFGSKESRESKEQALRGTALVRLAPCWDGNSSSGLVSLPSGDSGSFVSKDKIPPHSFCPQQGQGLPPLPPRISWVAERPLVPFQIEHLHLAFLSTGDKKAFVNLVSALNQEDTTLQGVYSPFVPRCLGSGAPEL